MPCALDRETVRGRHTKQCTSTNRQAREKYINKEGKAQSLFLFPNTRLPESTPTGRADSKNPNATVSSLCLWRRADFFRRRKPTHERETTADRGRFSINRVMRPGCEPTKAVGRASGGGGVAPDSHHIKVL